jgi:predicted benzoate:H+ symporter BenE
VSRARALLAGVLLSLCLAPAAASAQVFIASKPHPEFWIAPVFITANIRRGT